MRPTPVLAAAVLGLIWSQGAGRSECSTPNPVVDAAELGRASETMLASAGTDMDAAWGPVYWSRSGFPMLVVGVPGHDVSGNRAAGAVAVYFWRSIEAGSTVPDILFTGVAAHDRAGTSVRVNNCYQSENLGPVEIVIGAEQVDRVANPQDPEATGAGKIYVLALDETDLAHYPTLNDPSQTDVVSLATVGQPGGVPGVVFLGEEVGDRAGAAVSVCSYDWEGRFLAFGAPGASPMGRSGAGKLYSIATDSLAALPPVVPLGTIGTGVPGTIFIGEAAGDALGAAVARSQGLVAGAPGADVTLTAPTPEHWTDAGKVYVYISYGSGGPSPREIGDVACASPGLTCSCGNPSCEIGGYQLVGDQAGALLGSAVSPNGHVFGAPGFDVQDVGPDAGAAVDTGRVFSDGQVLRMSGVGTATPGTTWTGAAAGDRLGASVAEIGDVTGDDFWEIALGAPFADAPGATDAGAVFVVDGTAFGFLSRDTPESEQYHGTIGVGELSRSVRGFRVSGTSPAEHFGSSIAPLVDIWGNWDGWHERLSFAAGAPGRDGSGLASTGAAVVVYPLGGRLALHSSRVRDITGDHDGYADSGETFELHITVANHTDYPVSNVRGVLAASDPKIDCILDRVAIVGAVPARAVVESTTPFRLKLRDDANRASAFEAFAGDLTVLLEADELEGNAIERTVTLDFDLNSTAVAPTAVTELVEGFESGFGTMSFQNLDAGRQTNALSNGYRCQYNDPDFPYSNSYGNSECYMGFVSGQNPVNDWHVHAPATSDVDHAYLGSASLHYGKHTPGNPGLDTTSLSQMDAVRSAPVHLPARVCSMPQAGQVRACASESDCTDPASECIGATPTLSFKHQIATRPRWPYDGAADRGVIQVQIDEPGGTGAWQKLVPTMNDYDYWANYDFGNCTFDPVDDGNDEDDYFDPADPFRLFGPSSTCFPEFSFAQMGSTAGPFDPTAIGRASHGPGLAGSVGDGTWVESIFDLSRFHGRRVRFRYLYTSVKVSDISSWESLFMFNPIPVDDGWYVDDIRITQTRSGTPVTSVDTANFAGGSCGAGTGLPYGAIRFSDEATLQWDTSGAVEILRGDLTALRANGGDFRPTVLACLGNDVTTTSVEDSQSPSAGSGFYYLVRATGGQTTWSGLVSREVPGAGGSRDFDLDGPPRAPNACAAPP